MPSLCVIPGDGIGREVIPVAVAVLRVLVPDLQIETARAGWNCFQETGASVPEETLACLRECGAGLFGAVSSPAGKVDGYVSSILTMRRALNLYANIRPTYSLPGISPRQDVDLWVVRENSEGLYVGVERSDGQRAVAERHVTAHASRRLAEKAAVLARKLGRKKITVVHKANVLPLSDGLFRDTVRQTLNVDTHGRELEVDELLVDVAALKILAEPETLDLLITTNLFGDILSDAASHWMGGLGLAPSLNWGDGIALAEPVHGSAPDIAGLGVANPMAAILSAALLLRFAWDRESEATQLENAVRLAFEQEVDLLTRSTTAMGQAVIANLGVAVR